MIRCSIIGFEIKLLPQQLPNVLHLKNHLNLPRHHLGGSEVGLGPIYMELGIL